ncbi:MAG: DUF1566 domain-containing protein [Desulfobacterales bacterium]|nr:DUF1566 domain-containing protein [Desulfobacterales bacterium]
MSEPIEEITCPTCGTKITVSDPSPDTGPDYPVIQDAHALEWMAGPDRDMTWYEAKQWIASLQDLIPDRKWRLPADDELKALLPRFSRDLNTSGWWIWSADQDGPLSARGLDVRRGEVCTGGRELGGGGRVVAVRPKTSHPHTQNKGD